MSRLGRIPRVPRHETAASGDADATPGGFLTPEADLAADELRHRAGRGVVVLLARGALTRAIALVGALVLARMLGPRDFGIFALGATLIVAGGFLSGSGLGAALVRRERGPDRGELESLLGVQLLFTTVLAAIAFACAWPFGEEGIVLAIMVASVPLTAIRTPGLIVLERSLSYRPVAAAEILEAVVLYGWSIGTVLAGWGLWGVATAFLARAAAGSAAVLLATQTAPLRPRLSWTRLRGLLGFGAAFQGVALANVVRDQGLNVGVAAIAGLASLGIWTAARRILDVPYMLFQALWRVSFPAMARLLARGEDPAPMVQRALALTAISAGAVLAAVVAFAPGGVPAILGDGWADAATVVPWAALGLLIGGSVSVATAGFLYAVGDARTVLVGAVLHTAAWMLVAFPLLPVVGVEAVGMGWLVAALVEALILGRSTLRRIRVSIAAPLALPLLFAAAAAVAGRIVSDQAGDSLSAALAGAAVALAVYGVALLGFCRGLVEETFGIAGRALHASISRAP
jgi:O-antigen/teichoic acid export membrane protein